MHLDVWTLAFQTINFLVLVWLLHRFLYKPILAVMARRRVETERALKEAEAAEAQAREERSTLEAERAALAATRSSVVAEAERAAAQRRAEILEQARREAETLAQAARQRDLAEHAAALDELRSQALQLALSLAGELLRAARSPSVAEGFMAQALEHLSGLSAAEATSWHTANAPLEVVTAPALDEEARNRWRERLTAALHVARITFKTDDSLIAGAELRLPRGVVGTSWSRTLDDLREELSKDAVHPS